MKTRTTLNILHVICIGIILGNPLGCNKDDVPHMIKDIDGNIYKTVTIGNQVWIVENLKTTRYKNSDLIVTTVPATLNTGLESNPKYQWAYNGDENYASVYGRLYTWFTVTDVRGLCPAGWHVPSDEDWHSLVLQLDKNATYDVYESTVAGGKLKEAGTSKWIDPNLGADNESGFTALPGGFRYNNGVFYSLGYSCYWWSSTEDPQNDGNAMIRVVLNSSPIIGREPACKYDAYSVRCVMDNK